MKNLLVDALRGAQEEKTKTSSPAAERQANVSAQQRDAVRIEEMDATAEDFSLMETGVFQSDEFKVQSAGQDHIDVSADNSLTVSDRDMDIVPAERSPPTQDLGAASILEPAGRPSSQPRSLLGRLARYSPAMCLLTMSFAAGAFVIYEKLSAKHLNNDLSELSQHVQLDRIDNVGAPDSHETSTAAVANSELIDAAGEKGVVVLQVLPAETLISTPGTKAQASGSQGLPRIVVQSHRKNVDDAAFASVNLAYAAFNGGNYAAAEKEYRNALQIVPNHLGALAGIAAVLQETSRTAEAISYYERLLELDPNNGIAAAAVIGASTSAGSSEALSGLKALLQQYPDSSYLHYVLGVRYLDENLWPEASIAFLSAHQADPGNADYSYNLAVAMERLGDYESASFYFERALQSADSNADFDSGAVREHLGALAAASREVM